MRIVSLSPSVTEILFSLGLGDRIVANTYFCDYPLDAKKIAKAGDFSHLNIEKIRKFNPDYVITSTVVQDRSGEFFKDEKFIHLHYDPRSLDEIYFNILDLGKKLKTKQKADEIVSEMKIIEKEVFKMQPKHKYRVYTEEWFDPPMVSGNWVPDIIRLAGGIYFPLEKRTQSGIFRLKDLLVFDPDVIFLSDCGFKDKSDPKKIYERRDWASINAVKNKWVIPIDESILNRPGPRILQAAKQIQQELLAL